MQLVTTKKERAMNNRLITILLVVVFAMFGVGSTATAANNATPSSPGACNMLHTNDAGLIGMMNDPHVFDIMIPLVVASEAAGCTP
jgi:hypothetical protein